MNWQRRLKKFWAKKFHKYSRGTTAVAHENTPDTGAFTPQKAKIKECLTQFAEAPDGARDVRVIIGLDFGTAFTKVVIEVGKDKYSVPLNGNKQGTEKYLFPTRVYQDASGNLTVTESKNIVSPHTDLKMKILDGPMDKHTEKLIVTYIAWVLRKSRHWLMTEKQSVLGIAPLKWAVNIGLPTANYKDKNLKNTYRALVGKAWSMSTNPHLVNKGDEKPNDTDSELDPDFIGAFPEFVAQVQYYLSSPRRKQGTHTLIDVGAGTTDTTVFIVLEKCQEDNLTILTASVERLGTTYLAEHRCRKLGQSSDWRPNPQDPIPSRKKFARKLSVKREKIVDVDGEFKERVIKQVNSQLNYAKKDMAPKQPEWKTGVPLMLCGGGARVKIYKEVVNTLVQPGHGYPLQKSRLPAPDNLDALDISDKDRDRLSVAYGLSYDAFNLETIIDNILPFRNSSTGQGKSKCLKCNGTGGLHGPCPGCGDGGFC